MGKNLSSLYYVLIHYLRLGKNPDFWENISIFWKKSLLFGKNTLTLGKKSLTFGKIPWYLGKNHWVLGKKHWLLRKKSLTYGKKNSLIWGTNKIPLYFFAQYIVFYLGRIHDFRGKNPIIRVKLPNSLNPKIKNKKSVWLTFSQLSYFL